MRVSQARGVRDSPPNEEIIKERLRDSLKRVFQSYGYRPLDTPAIERYEVLSAKYAGGDEILSETFVLKDRGNRKLGLRYDLTVPLARFVAQNPQLKLPFKRYQMSKVWRDGPVGLGRYREFWQCDVDIIGSKSMNADAEILSIANDVFKGLGLAVEIRVNNRKLMNGILAKLNVRDKIGAILVIDKLDKTDEDGLIQEFKAKGFSSTTAKAILDLFKEIPKGNNKALRYLKEKLDSEEGQEGISELEQLFAYLKAYNVGAVLSPELARGLSYYTSTVFEVFLKEGKLKSSVAGGGRYDDMIGKYVGTTAEYPAVGISFGLDRIYDALVSLERVEKLKTLTRVFVIPIKTELEAIKICQRLRKAGICAETDVVGRGLSKNLTYANSLGIPYVIFVGTKELKTGKLKLRDMNSGKEQLLKIDAIIRLLRK